MAAATLEAGVEHIERALGHRMGPGGAHPHMGTHNRLSGLGGGEYLEVIAADPGALPPNRPRWFDLDRRAGPPRIGNWIVRTDDLGALVQRHPGAGRPITLTRGAYRWRMAVPDDGILPYDGCFPAVIEWLSAPPAFADVGLRMIGLTLAHPDADDLAGILSDLVDDSRIRIERGPPRLTASIETPDGVRTLT